MARNGFCGTERFFFMARNGTERFIFYGTERHGTVSLARLDNTTIRCLLPLLLGTARNEFLGTVYFPGTERNRFLGTVYFLARNGTVFLARLFSGHGTDRFFWHGYFLGTERNGTARYIPDINTIYKHIKTNRFLGFQTY